MTGAEGPWVATAVAVAAAVAAAGTGVALRVARARRLLHPPNERSSHTVPTARTGGTAIAAAILAALAAAALAAGRASLAWPALSVAAAAVVGLIDDLRPLRPRTKMAGLVLAAALALPLGWVERVELPFLGTLELGPLGPVLTLLWLVGFTNAFNFMDGIDGIAAGTAVVAGGVYLAAVGLLVPAAAAAAAAAAGAAVGFLPWNFPRARIFMGDAGSLSLGLLLAECAVLANRAPEGGSAGAALPFPASVLLLGPFVFDVAFTLVRRAAEGKRLGEAHREHLYQRIARRRGGHVGATLLYLGFAAGVGALVVRYPRADEAQRLVSLVLPLLGMLAFAVSVLRADRSQGARPRG